MLFIHILTVLIPGEGGGGFVAFRRGDVNKRKISLIELDSLCRANFLTIVHHHVPQSDSIKTRCATQLTRVRVLQRGDRTTYIPPSRVTGLCTETVGKACEWTAKKDTICHRSPKAYASEHDNGNRANTRETFPSLRKRSMTLSPTRN